MFYMRGLFMKKKLMVLLGILILSPLAAQNEGSIAYIQQLSQKQTAECSDAVRLFVLQSGKAYTNFNQGLEYLVQTGVLKTKEGYQEKKPLRRGQLALMTTRYLMESDSFMYSLFGSERYAYTSCVSLKLMEGGRSEWDDISGSELIEVLGKISAKKEEGNAK
jgi:hypothetical protein